MRLEDKIAVVVGGGQQPGETTGNGRATCLRFAEEGATVVVVDHNIEWAEDTVRMIKAKGGSASALAADITREADCKSIADTCVARHGRIDILHNNVGRARGDKGTVELEAEMWDELMAMNIKGMFMTIKHVLPVMRAQRSGAIVNISSTSSIAAGPALTYRVSKSSVNSLTQHVAMENAPHGIRCNAILPGLMNTPMAIERRARERNVSRDQVRQERAALVPLSVSEAGNAFDVANAAVFLASEEARYITGVLLPVDGGLLLKIG
ncbi:MAG: SDR family NAD(P)-dependent oxidoreductase [Hyphomicrobiaceae bacterium]|nr:SDR family NAD(P)-dependent oxidoreductase [Hyphomicrobiaceae bacterium]